jgi:hypothetical protein
MSSLAQEPDKHVLTVAGEIQRYLLNHPNAADSSEGVLRWWLKKQRYEDSMEIVQRALELLVTNGEVEKSETFGGGPVYSSAFNRPRQDKLH